MADKTLLVFTHRGLRYGLEAKGVKEIIPLPELTPVEEVSPFIAGVLNLRGQVIPVMDLDLLFGHAPQRYHLSDQVILLESEGIVKGIIVNEVLDVKTATEADIEPVPVEVAKKFVLGEAKLTERLVMLLDHGSVLRFAPDGKEKREALAFCPEATPDERQIFHQRALVLMEQPEQLIMGGLSSLAVFSLSGEYFGVELDVVKEFSNLIDPVPVPCTPAHIVGNINLRGDILTLVDIRSVLNMPMSKPEQNARIIVGQVGELIAGVPVGDVFDVLYLRRNEIKPVPTAVEPVSNDYIKGTFPYGGKMLSILDLKKILTDEKIIVDEAV